MNQAVVHRGPDGEGLCFLRTDAGVPISFRGEAAKYVPKELPVWNGESFPHDLAFGHQRFAIVDLSPGGHQPLCDTERSLVLSFNGEVYNYLELRSELEGLGQRFRTRGDAEVFLAAYRQWGEACFSRLQGFWAVALWDGKRKALLLSRDRMGKAPLYYARQGGRLWWSSEIKGVLAGAGRSGFPVHAEAVRQFVRAGLRDVKNETFYAGIRTFPRASYAWVQADGNFSPVEYWSLPAQRLRANDLGPDEAVLELRRRLQAAVRLRLRADVPVGLELSGGLDSSTLAALAAMEHGENTPPREAFTVGFPGTEWDETPFAAQVVARWPSALRHQVLIPDPVGVLRGLDSFQAQMDEPFHSPNMILNRDIWRRMADQGMRVSLNGAGGDEVFAGYASEYLGPYARQLLASGKFALAFQTLWKNSERVSLSPKDGLRALWQLLPHALRNKIRSPWPAPEWDPFSGDRDGLPSASESIDQRLHDHLTDLKMNYWLRSGNTSFMGVPLEVRIPLLDPHVVEWACALPMEYLIRDGWLKWVLRKAVEPWLPESVVWRRVKMGFPFPLSEWLLQSKPAFAGLRAGEDLPLLNRRRLFDAYDVLARKYPAYCWRCLCVLLWWERCVLETPILLKGVAKDLP